MARSPLRHALAAAVVGIACGGRAHPTTPATRSRAACEAMLRRGVDLERENAEAVMANPDHRGATLDARLAEMYERARAAPTFLSACRRLTDAQYRCAMTASDLVSFDRCDERD